MTYPAGPGTITNSYGPSTPNGPTSGQATPFPAPGAGANVAQSVPAPASYNFANTITSTREVLNGIGYNIAQQGLAYNVNTSSVILAGLRTSDFSYYSSVNGTKG